jgi:hypothetical protein
MPLKCVVKTCENIAAFKRGAGASCEYWCGMCYKKLLKREKRQASRSSKKVAYGHPHWGVVCVGAFKGRSD